MATTGRQRLSSTGGQSRLAPRFVLDQLQEAAADLDAALVDAQQQRLHVPEVLTLHRGVNPLDHWLVLGLKDVRPRFGAHLIDVRSDERRLGKECVITVRYGWSPYT